MTPYKLLIFDWDGTLMDSVAKIVNCIQIAAKSFDLPIPSYESARNVIGISLKPALATVFDFDLQNEKQSRHVDELVAAYKTSYLDFDQTPCPLFDGVPDMLERLKLGQQDMAVATGKARRGLHRAWENTSTGHYFMDSRCSDEAESKPSSDMLIQLLQANNLDVSEAVMIGDTSYDMQMAQQIGMDRIAVSYGVHSKDTLAQFAPLGIASSVPELENLLAQ